MPLASHLRCVALALGISTALGCANRNQPAPRAESLDPGLSRGGGNPRRRAARPVVDATRTWAEPPGGRRAAPQPRPGRSRCPCPRAPRSSARRTGRTLATDRGRLWLPVWARRRRPDPRRSHRRETCAASGNTPPASTCPYQLDLWGEVRARIAAARRMPKRRKRRATCSGSAWPARPPSPTSAPAPWRDGREVQRRSVGLLDASLALSERPARRRPFQRAAATPAAGLARADPRRAADASSAAARGTLRTGAARRALAAPVGRSCRDLRRHTATAPCPAHRRRLEPAGAPPGRPRGGRSPPPRRPARAGQSRAVPAHQLRRRRRNLPQ